jgi:hypothetical protein
MTSIRVSLTILCALSLAFALPATAQETPCARCSGFNTATGKNAFQSNTFGELNTATGGNALFNNTEGDLNAATGNDALFSNTTGEQNTAMGRRALFSNTTGDNNTALGHNAGANVTGSNNIHIGNEGVATDTARIRIGTVGIQTATSIAGIFGAPSLGGVSVEVNRNGRLGTVLSSRRVKDDIRDMAEASAGLGKLRPVTFHYKAEPATGPRSIEYGLIAEEVAEIYPELVVLDRDGQPSGVRYHVLPAMLLNELQRQQRVIEGQASRLTEYDERFRDQSRLIDELTARLSRLEAKGAAAAGR